MSDPRLATSPSEAALDRLQWILLDMAGRAEELVRMAVQGLRERDANAPKLVRRADDRIDELEVEMDERVIEFLALHHPPRRRPTFGLRGSQGLERRRAHRGPRRQCGQGEPPHARASAPPRSHRGMGDGRPGPANAESGARCHGEPRRGAGTQGSSPKTIASTTSGIREPGSSYRTCLSNLATFLPARR